MKLGVRVFGTSFGLRDGSKLRFVVGRSELLDGYFLRNLRRSERTSEHTEPKTCVVNPTILRVNVIQFDKNECKI